MGMTAGDDEARRLDAGLPGQAADQLLVGLFSDAAVIQRQQQRGPVLISTEGQRLGPEFLFDSGGVGFAGGVAGEADRFRRGHVDPGDSDVEGEAAGLCAEPPGNNEQNAERRQVWLVHNG